MGGCCGLDGALSLLTRATVKAGHAMTASQVNTLDHADTPGAVPEQVLVNVMPELEV